MTHSSVCWFQETGGLLPFDERGVHPASSIMAWRHRGITSSLVAFDDAKKDTGVGNSCSRSGVTRFFLASEGLLELGVELMWPYERTSRTKLKKKLVSAAPVASTAATQKTQKTQMTQMTTTSARTLLRSLEAMALGGTPRGPLAVGEVRLLERALADAISANEELDDFSVYALRCMCVPYHLALVYDAEGGIDKKRQALACYDGFLDRCLRHGVLEPNVRRWAETCIEMGDDEGGERRAPTAMSREQKIDMFKTERELARSISALRADGGGEESRAEDMIDAHIESNGGLDRLDDAELRPLYLMMISQFAIKACNARQLVRQEVDMLEAVAAMPEDARVKMKRDIRGQSQGNERVMGKLREAVQGLSAGEGGKREALRLGVFQPSHLLPTVTVEQFGDMEVARMRAEEQRKSDVQADERRRQGQSLNGRAEREAEEEAALQKLRAFDDFKDANKRGSGNSKLRNTR